MTKEQDFKIRFAAVLKDLQQTGSKDNQAMGLLGQFAAELADSMQRQSWTDAKAAMSPKQYDTLLKAIESQGNEHHAAGRDKHAYAIQVLAISLIARTQRVDPQMQAGEALFDGIVDYTAAVYRKLKKATAN